MKMHMIVDPENVPLYEPTSSKLVPLNPAPSPATNSRHSAVPFDSLHAPVAREYIIDGILEVKAIAMMYGPPATGKSFAVLDMMCAVATQKPWMGRSTTKANVMYVCLERFEQVKYRLDAWKQVHKTNSVPAYIDTYPYQLSDPADVAKMIAEIENARTEDVKHTLVVIDTLSQAIVGQDENLQSVMSRLMGACSRIITATDCTVLLVHHASKTDSSNARGSSVLMGAVSTALNVRNAGQSKVITVEKQSDGVSGHAIKFQLLPVTLVDGQREYATSVVPEWLEDIAVGIAEPRVPTKLLDLLREMLPGPAKYKAQCNGDDTKLPIARTSAFEKANEVLYKNKSSIDAARKQFNRDLTALSGTGSVEVKSRGEILVSPFDVEKPD